MPRDCFGRAKSTHACPRCDARFLGPGECRGVGDGPGRRAHEDLVPTLPIYGCIEPPPRKFLVALPVTIMASTEAKAQEQAQAMVERDFPKQFVERHGWKLRAHAVETMAEANFKRRMEWAAKNGGRFA